MLCQHLTGKTNIFIYTYICVSVCVFADCVTSQHQRANDLHEGPGPHSFQMVNKQ